MREQTFSNEIGRINKQMDSLETKLVSVKDLIDFCIFWINEYEQSCSPLAKAKIVELNNVISQVVGMPHEEPEADEWCTDCKEYDSEKHNCPRFNRVIRETVEEIQAERTKGQWIDMGDFEQCSVCGGTHLKEFQSYYGKTTWIKTNFCPNCGADLRGEQE